MYLLFSFFQLKLKARITVFLSNQHKKNLVDFLRFTRGIKFFPISIKWGFVSLGVSLY